MVSIHLTPYSDNPQAYGRDWQEALASQLPRLITQYVWSPHVWVDGIRKGSQWAGCNHLVLDYDSPPIGIEEMYKILMHKRIAHIIGATKSHQREKHGIVCDRYRLILPLERPVHDPDVYAYLYDEALKYPTLKGADTACRDLARWYVPCRSLQGKLDGPGLALPGIPKGFDDDEALQWIRAKTMARPQQPETKAERANTAGSHNRVVEGILARGLVQGSRNSDLYKVCCHLTREGYRDHELRRRLDELLSVGTCGLSDSEIWSVIRKAAEKVAASN